MVRLICSITLLCFWTVVVFAQVSLEQARAAWEAGQSKQALGLVRDILAQGAKQDKTELRAQALGLEAEILSDLGQLSQAAERLAAELKALEPLQGLAWAATYKTLGQTYFQLQNDVLAFEALKRSLDLNIQAQAPQETLGRAYVNVLALARLLYRYEDMRYYLEQSKGLELSLSEAVAGSLLYERGNYHALIAETQTALAYYQQAEILLDAANMQAKLAELQTHKGEILIITKAYPQAKRSLQNALANFKSLNKQENIVITLRALANCFWNWDKNRYADSTLFYARLAYEQSKEVSLATKLETEGTLLKYLVLSQDPNPKLEAEVKNFDAKLTQNKEILLLGLAYQDLTQIYLHLQQYPRALATCQILVQALELKTEVEDKVLKSLNNKDFALKILALQAKAQLGLNQTPALEQGLQTLILFDRLADFNRQEYAQNARFRDADLNKDTYEYGLEICYALYQKDPQNRYLQQAFYFAEKSKSLGLFEQLQQNQALNLLKPQEQQALQTLRLQILGLEQDLFQFKQDPKNLQDRKKLQDLEQNIFKAQQKRQDLQNSYPEYARRIQAPAPPSPQAIQAQLQSDQALIAYFLGDRQLYIFHFQKDKLSWTRQALNTDLNALISQFRQTIYGFYLENSDYANSQLYQTYAQAYNEQAQAFYQLLFQPLGPLPPRLILIPDGPLGHLPFEALIRSSNPKPSQFKDYDYLLKHHAFSYLYAAALLTQTPKSKSAPQSYLGFAPSFGTEAAAEIRGRRFSLSPLQFNTLEVEQAHKRFGGQALFGPQATQTAFKELAPNYQILHLATHGMANDQDPDFALIAFTETNSNQEQHFLYVRDLYEMQLQADLVLLSACETALGPIERGEGVLSLARAFTIAGAQSVFTTLWSVNDQAAAQIVSLFYENLQKGLPKDLALQQAKLTFIQKSDDRAANPFFWSPFILVGQTQALELNNTWLPPLAYVLLASLLLALGLYLRQRRKTTQI